VGERPTGEQAALLEVVATALDRAVGLCRAGTEYREAHRAAALVIGAGLAEAGILHGRPEDLVARGAVSLFFPHGIGHMVGLGVRDAGELLPGRELDRALYPGLRIDLPLEAGHVVTIEPGLYFVPALLDDPAARERLRDAVAWERVEAMLGFGGIRLEHNVLVTDGEPEVLSAAIP
jgi:Xaa-Pro aminopeptidase